MKKLKAVLMNTCKICASNTDFLYRSTWGQQDISLVKCILCQHVQISHDDDQSGQEDQKDSELITDFHYYNYTFNKNISLYDHKWERNLANYFLIQQYYSFHDDHNILEIGPSYDGVLEEIRRGGHKSNLMAFEPCPKNKNQLEKLGVSVFQDIFNSKNANEYLKNYKGKIDLIISSNQMYYDKNPQECLQTMYDLLSPHGVALVIVQNSASFIAKHQSAKVTSPHFFSKLSFQKILQTSNFKIEFFNTRGKIDEEKIIHNFATHYKQITNKILRKVIFSINNFLNKIFRTRGHHIALSKVLSPAFVLANSSEFKYGDSDDGGRRYQLVAVLKKPV